MIIFCRVKDMAEDRHKKLDESNALHQFYRDLDDEESWIKYVIPPNTVKYLKSYN